MRLSTAKDKVLKSLVKNDPLFKDLEIDKDTINAALVQLAEEKYITVIPTSVSGSGMIRTYMPQSVLPLGAHFCNTGESFRIKSIKKWIRDFPKNYWFVGLIIAFLTSLGFNIVAIIRHFLK